LIAIKELTINDLERLQKIARQTFQETFSASNSEENMKTYLREGFSTEKLTAELNDKNASFYFAILDQEIIGYLKLNIGEAHTEFRDLKALEIERIYVLDEFQGKKVGQLLFAKAFEVAKQKKLDYIWLGVWEKNLKAISFYQKNGFIAFDTHIFKLGDDEQIDIMMKLMLNTHE
jgi:diamine N-acetyltransferase